MELHTRDTLSWGGAATQHPQHIWQKKQLSAAKISQRGAGSLDKHPNFF